MPKYDPNAPSHPFHASENGGQSASGGSSMKRIQIEMTPQRFAELNRHMELCDLESKKDLFNTVYTLFEEALEAVCSGKDIGIIDRKEKKYEVLKLPPLEVARRKTFGASQQKSARE